MSTPKITIVGLGPIGKSIGKTLCMVGGQLQVVGHDREPLVARGPEGSRCESNSLESA